MKITAYEVAARLFDLVEDDGGVAGKLEWASVIGPDAGEKSKDHMSAIEIITDEDDGEIFYVVEVTRHRRTTDEPIPE